jgi:hypothetical protein
MLTPILSHLVKEPSSFSSAEAETTPPVHCMLAASTMLVLPILLPVNVKEHVAGLVLLPLANTAASRRPASKLQHIRRCIRVMQMRRCPKTLIAVIEGRPANRTPVRVDHYMDPSSASWCMYNGQQYRSRTSKYIYAHHHGK